MLKALTVRNFVLVDRLDIEFGAGLTVITGESGAGKSILLDALSLVLGARARRAQIRPGTAGCDVSAEFDVSGQPQALAVLAEQEAFGEETEGHCLVRRAASAEGRSRAFVNGAAVTAAVLARLAEPLIDIHGQDQHRLIMRPDQQRRLLDDFGADATLVAAVADAHRRRSDASAALEAARVDAQRRQERRALLAYQTEELGALGDDIARFVEIAATHRRLSRAREIVAAIGAATTEIRDDLGSRATHILRAIEEAQDPHENLARAGELMASVQVYLEEAGDELRRYLDSFDAADETLADVDARLSALHEVARRHRVPPATLAEHLAALNAELAELADEDTRVEGLEAAANAAATEFDERAKRLSAQRRQA
ncbi:MAG: AAA family ATPase, partial [Gammaproteobacteria bacterium]|nr:AAA family ATPase [Gammaproteobacteria bacterium]